MEVPRLVDVPKRLVDVALDRAVTVVVAPAGFGKTTLVNVWGADLEAPRSVVRIDRLLDPAGGLDLGLAITAAAAELGLSSAVELTDLLPLNTSRLGDEFIRALAEGLRGIASNYVLVFEDLHLLPEPLCRELGSLISHLATPRHRFIVTSRTMPPWPVQRWRLSGFASLLTVGQLRLRPDETLAAIGLGTSAHARELAALTGGWPAAIQVVRWHPDASDASRTLIRDNLVDYVLGEVLPGLPEHTTRVLTRLAVLEPFPIEVGTEVTRDQGTESILRETMEVTALVTVSEDRHYTIHPIIREALLHSLRESEPGAEGELQLRAGQAWLSQTPASSSFEHATDHLIAAQAWPSALEVIRTRWSDAESTGRLDRLVQWLDQIPEQHWRTDPELVPLYVLANLRLGRSATAMAAAQRSISECPPQTAAVVRLAHSSTVGWNVDPAVALAQCREILPTLTTLDATPQYRGFEIYPGATNHGLAARISICQALTLQGEFAQAAAAYRSLLDHPESVSPLTQVALWGGYGAALAMAGEVEEAEGWINSALQLAEDTGSPFHVRSFAARIGRAAAATVRGETISGLALVEEAANAARPSRATNFLRTCDIIAILCGAEERYVESVDPPLVARPLPLADQFLGVQAARLESRAGRHVSAMMRVQAVRPHELTIGAWTEVVIAARGRRAARNWLATVPATTTVHGQAIRLLADAAVTDDAREAVDQVETAATLVEAKGIHRVLHDAPRQLWLRDAVLESSVPIVIAARTRVSENSAAHRPAFTGRELDLAQLLPLELTMSQLAERMFVSVHTLKWHRANLYRKLGVRTRQEAIRRSTELGLLS